MRQDRSQAGVAIVETAVVLSLLFLLLFGVMEFATLFYNRGVIINASREGARFGAVFDVDTGTWLASAKTDAEIIQRVKDYSEGHLISFSPNSGQAPNVTITPNWATRVANGNGGPLRVDVSYQFSFLLLPNLAASMVGGSNLSAETFVRME